MAIVCAGWVLHQLVVCAALGEAFKRIASTQGCGWIREMGSAESCCVVWPPNGLRVDCGSQLADEVAVQTPERRGGWDLMKTRPAETMLASVGVPPFTLLLYNSASQLWGGWNVNIYLLLILDIVLDRIGLFFCDTCLWERHFVLEVMFHQTPILFPK